MSERSILTTVLICHFATAFMTLGMPPFFGTVLTREFGNSYADHLGLLYVLPTFLAALVAPLWGRLADRLNKRDLLVRAHLGLMVSFWVAGWATDIRMFIAALILQGVLGGAFAASRAYLAAVLSKGALERALDLTEASPRLALVLAPLALGWVMGSGEAHPLSLYRILSVLPLMSALVTLRLPRDGGGQLVSAAANSKKTKSEVGASDWWLILLVQFALGLAPVLVAPYFVSSVGRRFDSLSNGELGLLFGLPHFVYLLLAPWVGAFLDRTWRGGRAHALMPALALYAGAFAGQGIAHSLIALLGWRLLMGVAMTASFVALHAALSRRLSPGEEGRAFASLDAMAKYGSVAGGLVTTFVVRALDPDATFFMAAIVLIATVLVFVPFHRGRLHEQQPEC